MPDVDKRTFPIAPLIRPAPWRQVAKIGLQAIAPNRSLLQLATVEFGRNAVALKSQLAIVDAPFHSRTRRSLIASGVPSRYLWHLTAFRDSSILSAPCLPVI